MRKIRVAFYVRVSTDSQTVENQLVELHKVAANMGWDIAAVFADKGVSGAKGRAQRPQFAALLRGVARKDFDVVAAWSVDRLGRSLLDLVNVLQEMHAMGIDLYLHQQGINTMTPAGKAMFQMMGVFAEFERSMIQERVKAGLERARKHGTKSGKPIGRPSTSETVEARILELRAEGQGILRIAKQVGCGTSVVQRVVSAMG